ncbi:MAG: hypothetical protein DME24_12810 [Verrucomicrobia bacterium]|nr:MAG: hypothetical protein DME24_12810 [Verrucomicrobiota bacterium]
MRRDFCRRYRRTPTRLSSATMAHRPLPRRINSSLRWLITSRCRGRFEAPSDLRTPQSLGSTSVFIRWILCQSPTPHRCRVICLRASAFPKPFWLGLWVRILRNYLARLPATRSQSLAWSTGSIPSAPQPISRATSRSLGFRERTNVVIPCVAIATNITQLQFGGGLPSTALTAPVAYATPSGNPDDACLIGTNSSLAGKIVLLDRGATNCDSAFKAEQAQLAGAVAVLQITPEDTGFPFRLGDINTNVRIPVLVIADSYGAALLKSYLTNGIAVTATIRGDGSPRIAEWDGPKGFGAVDVTVGFAVPAAGVYPMRLVAGQGSGAADLEWFSIKPDGTRILVNDTSKPDALLAFRARNAGAVPVLNVPTLSGANVTVSWTGVGMLEEAATLVRGPWGASSNQNNPQTIPSAGSAKFYRIRQL